MTVGLVQAACIVLLVIIITFGLLVWITRE